MRIFVTGASGFIGSAVVSELLAAGHSVLGLARSDASAAALTAAGAEVHRGTLDDPASLRSGAEATEGVVHMAYNHDFSQMAAAAQTDLRAVQTFGEVLRGTGHPLLIASGVLGLASGRAATEHDDSGRMPHPRSQSAQATLALAEQGVRSAVVRFAPTVHGEGDHGFVHTLIEIARQRGVSAYIGDGGNHWPAVHRLDAANLVRLATETVPAGSVLHAVAEEGIEARTIAEAIGRHLNLPVVSVTADEAGEHFGWIARFFALDGLASSAHTRELLHWQPTHAGLIEDLDRGHYFQQTS
ncbi:SDR family oxidoreductase [Deinococcus altitudinis]|uniref:SDR family oxidoreductase n=1 Tax=Deinococcus altitudinis TaxID=468914 RepID=UPI003892A592